MEVAAGCIFRDRSLVAKLTCFVGSKSCFNALALRWLDYLARGQLNSLKVDLIRWLQEKLGRISSFRRPGAIRLFAMEGLLASKFCPTLGLAEPIISTTNASLD
jgi:hypothetical protein